VGITATGGLPGGITATGVYRVGKHAGLHVGIRAAGVYKVGKHAGLHVGISATGGLESGIRAATGLQGGRAPEPSPPRGP
jgi:hypothetical protein